MTYIPRLDDSIYILKWLSERTYNALIKHWISHIGDFYKYKDDIRVLGEMRWVWNNAINELNQALSEFEWYRYFSLNWFFERYSDWVEETEAKNNPPEETIIPPYFKYNNSKYYINSPAFIVFEDKKVRWAFIRNWITFNDLINIKDLSKIRWIWIKTIPDIKIVKDKISDYITLESKYAENVKFSEIDEIDLFMLLSNYYDNIWGVERIIINQRLKWFTDSDDTELTLREIGEKYDLTNERIRQVEGMLTSEFEYFIWFHSELLYNYFNNNLLNNRDVVGYKHEELGLLNHLSYEVLCIIFNTVFWKYWSYICHYNDENQSFFFIKDNWILNKIQIKDLLKIIDKKCSWDRATPKHIKVKDLINNTIWNFENSHPEISEFANQICEKYIETCYWISIEDWAFDLVSTRRNYWSIIMYELWLLNEPIHYKELCQVLCNKYPQFKRKEQTILSRFIENDEVVNVWKWLYIKKSKSMKWWTIKELAEDFLEKKWKPVTYKELISYIQKNKIVKTESIDSMLFTFNKDTFVKYNNWEIWLVKWNLPMWEKEKFLGDKILEFLVNHKWEYFSCEDLLNTWKFWDDIIKIRGSVYHYRRKDKIKILKKWKFSYFYYE